MRRILFPVLTLALVAHCSPSAAAQQTTGTPPVRIGGNIPPPSKIKEVKPVYPPEAQQARASGIVIIEATIGEDGKVRDAVVKRSIPLLDQAALSAVRQWEFTPTLVNGAPVPVVMTVTVNFTLDGAPPPAFPVAQVPATILLMSNRSQNGPSRAWEIGSERARSLAHWNPETDTLSLTVPEATRIARAWLAGRNPQAPRLDLQSVSLTHTRRFTDIDFWFYQLNFFGNDPAQPGPLIAVVLPDGSVVEPSDTSGTASAPAPAPAEPRVYQPGGDVTSPRAIREAKAVYTQEALRRKIAGTVLIQGVVGIDGALHDPRVVRSLDPIYGLDDEALKAARQWQFAPGTRAGQPVAVTVVIEITFSAR
jgi:TonB family protein